MLATGSFKFENLLELAVDLHPCIQLDKGHPLQVLQRTTERGLFVSL
jgi:hypothetical protein